MCSHTCKQIFITQRDDMSTLQTSTSSSRQHAANYTSLLITMSKLSASNEVSCRSSCRTASCRTPATSTSLTTVPEGVCSLMYSLRHSKHKTAANCWPHDMAQCRAPHTRTCTRSEDSAKESDEMGRCIACCKSGAWRSCPSAAKAQAICPPSNIDIRCNF